MAEGGGSSASKDTDSLEVGNVARMPSEALGRLLVPLEGVSRVVLRGALGAGHDLAWSAEAFNLVPVGADSQVWGWWFGAVRDAGGWRCSQAPGLRLPRCVVAMIAPHTGVRDFMQNDVLYPSFVIQHHEWC